MSMNTFGPPPDSPSEPPQSPPPPGVQGDIELELIGLANALYNLGTTVVNDSTKEIRQNNAGANGVGDNHAPPAKPVGQRVNDVIGHLAAVEELAESITTMIPFQALQDIDNAKNPMNITRDRLERAATENQFMNGKIQAIESYRILLNTALAEHFPEIAPYLDADAAQLSIEPSVGSASNEDMARKTEA